MLKKIMLIVVSTTIFHGTFNSASAEVFKCKHIFNGETRDSFRKRDAKNPYIFEVTNASGVKIIQDVLYEDDHYLILGSPASYSKFNGYLVFFLDKRTNDFTAETTVEPREHLEYSFETIMGTCEKIS
jgi:hypothetical protein